MSDIISLVDIPTPFPDDAPEWARALYLELQVTRQAQIEMRDSVANTIENLLPLVDTISKHPMVKMLGGSL